MSGNPHPAHLVGHANLFRERRAGSRRSSSWDRTGANTDWITVEPHETATLLDVSGPGCVTHLYAAFFVPDPRDYRNAIVRCYWDDAETPSVEVPFGDLFAQTSCRTREFSSQFVAVNAGFGGSHGYNLYFPMPFADGARITIENRSDRRLGGLGEALWFHVEYETYDEPLPDDVQRFHASWRSEPATEAVGPEPNVTLHDAENLSGDDNYVVLDTVGAGRMVGLVLDIDNVQGPVWYGEGDDMVFIDGEVWPPSIHGTGTEEIFGGGASPNVEYAGQHTGFHLVESADYAGHVGMYRWYLDDPIHFSSSIRWTLEHGHANNFANSYSSVAYWYQKPQGTLPELPSAEEMTPDLGADFTAAWAAAADLYAVSARLSSTHAVLYEGIRPVWDLLYRGQFAESRELASEWLARVDGP